MAIGTGTSTVTVSAWSGVPCSIGCYFTLRYVMIYVIMMAPVHRFMMMIYIYNSEKYMYMQQNVQE